MPLEQGAILNDRYRIETTIAKGGMGAVYRAFDQILNVPVAVKENLFASEGSSRQFRHEATILAGVRHPNLPRVTDHFVINKVGQYLVMDFIEGEDLREQIKRIGKIPEEEVIRIGRTICDALIYLHNSEPPVLHRDIKPGNIKITPEGQIYLVDFGLAKIVKGGQSTTTGAQSLTPGYAPPEQYGTGTDQRSDIYSLGATLYAALTGKIPEDGISRAMGTSKLTPIARHNPFVSPEISKAIEKSMAVAPEDRYQTAAAFKESLSLEPIHAIESGKMEKTRSIQKTVVAPRIQKISKSSTKRYIAASIILGILILAGILLLPQLKSLLKTPIQANLPIYENAASPTLTLTFAREEFTRTPVPPTQTELPPTAQPTTTLLQAMIGKGKGLLAFSSNRDGAPQIYIMNINGENVKRITNLPDGACQPDWSPDGSKLAFISPCDGNNTKYPQSSLFIINADGTGLLPLRTIPGGDYEPDWSPDGNLIAFTTLRDGLPHLYTYDIKENSFSRLSNPANTDRSPAWSPDGKFIAFESNRLGQPLIFIMDSSGGNIQQVTRLENGNSFLPSWSPDGNALVYSQGSSRPQLVIMILKGSDIEEIRVNEDLRPASDANFSPDGEYLACESDGEIFILRIDGTGIENLTNNPAIDFDPAWSP